MTKYGSKYLLQAYVDQDLYEFILREKGEGSISSVINDILSYVKDAVTDEQKSGAQEENIKNVA